MNDYKIPEQDKALFRQMTRSVKPLPKNGTKAGSDGKNRYPPKLAPTTNSLTYNLSSQYPDVVGPDSVLFYVASDLPPKEIQRLKKGNINWQAQLDLHGMRTDDAKEALCNFIVEQTHLEHRQLLIIHGKGSPNNKEPIIKNHVNHWLMQLPQILAFHSAQPRHGGTGALYVTLKRNKTSK